MNIEIVSKICNTIMAITVLYCVTRIIVAELTKK